MGSGGAVDSSQWLSVKEETIFLHDGLIRVTDLAELPSEIGVSEQGDTEQEVSEPPHYTAKPQHDRCPLCGGESGVLWCVRSTVATVTSAGQHHPEDLSAVTEGTSPLADLAYGLCRPSTAH